MGLKKCVIKVFNIYRSTKKFASKCFMTQEMCDKTVNIYFFVFDSISNWYKTQEMCDK